MGQLWAFQVAYTESKGKRYATLMSVDKVAEAPAYTRADHDLGCCPSFWDIDGMSLVGHRQRNLCAVWRLQQCRRGENDFLGVLSRWIPSPADADDFLLFSHCLHVAYQGITKYHWLTDWLIDWFCLQCFDTVAWWWGAGMVICLERGADLHMAQRIPLPLTVSCFSKIQIGFTFLVPAYPGSPWQRAIKWVCVCVCVFVSC